MRVNSAVSSERTAAMNVASSVPSGLASVMVIILPPARGATTTDDVAEDF